MEFSKDFAEKMDGQDELAKFRNRFIFPQHNGEDVIYFTGNSLGLQPVTAKEALNQELDDWAEFGVEGHFEAKNPWFSYHEAFKSPSAELVGAKPSEVTAMNGLTVNLHLLLVSFYQPTGKRNKILCEAKAFPSDQYALETHVKSRGLDPDDCIVELYPRDGEHTIRHEDVIARIEELGDELALIMIGGVNYYTGQVFDMESITQAGHHVGAKVGFDLAHGAGNIQLKLHDWGVDFAAWCSYKYLNSGPGSVSGIFIHEKNGNDASVPRYAGWWGNDPKTRFKMEKGFIPIKGADSWQLSNAPVFSMAVYKKSLDIFMEAGMDKLTAKSHELTNYLEFVISHVAEETGASFEIITPKDSKQRGCQLSVLTHNTGVELFNKLTERGVIADWREPNVIRMAPVPLYNSFQDVYKFGLILKESLA